HGDQAQGSDFQHRRIRHVPPGLLVPWRFHQSEGEMISTRTRASAMLVAFGAIGLRPAIVAAHPIPNDATIVSLSVVPATGRADVVIRVDGSVTLKHFTMSKPDKIVVD